MKVPFANKLIQTIWLASHVGLRRARALEGWTGWDLSSPKAVVPSGPDAVALTRVLALAGHVEDGTPDGINLEGADYVKVDGFRVDNATGTITRAGIRSVTNQGVIISHNVCDRSGTWGIFTGFSQDVLIEGNELAIEDSVDFVSGIIAFADAAGCARVEASEAAENRYNELVKEVANATLFPTATTWVMVAPDGYVTRRTEWHRELSKSLRRW